MLSYINSLLENNLFPLITCCQKSTVGLILLPLKTISVFDTRYSHFVRISVWHTHLRSTLHTDVCYIHSTEYMYLIHTYYFHSAELYLTCITFVRQNTIWHTWLHSTELFLICIIFDRQNIHDFYSTEHYLTHMTSIRQNTIGHPWLPLDRTLFDPRDFHSTEHY